jgi:peptide/nickel transport system substrate-binding protein
MDVRRRFRLPLALVVAFGLAITGCGGPGAGEPAGPVQGEPQPGGELSILTQSEPRSLDPVQLSNSYATHNVVGNALYGQLVRTTPTGEIEWSQAEGLTTADGLTYQLRLKAGLVFSDGTPLDAAAVKANWDRTRDPKIAAPSTIAIGVKIAETTVVDPTTLAFILLPTERTENFVQAVAISALNYIGSPTALQAGPQAFDAKPIGSGPFVLESWTRGGEMVLTRNPRYFDQPRPYLDRLVVRTDPDLGQRFSALQAGDVDAVLSAGDDYTAQARDLGLVATSMTLNGGAKIILNGAALPFDDLRARQALRAALDLDQLNQVLTAGEGEVPTTLLAGAPATAPTTAQRDRAQQLFDELAAEGRAVDFTFASFNTSESTKLAQAVQAQLATYRNVGMQIQTVDYPTGSAQLARGEFQASAFGTVFLDPYPVLSTTLSTGGSLNYGEFSDPQLDAALAEGNASQDPEVRRRAYEVVQERTDAIVPDIYYARPRPAVLSSTEVGGIELYGLGSLRVDLLWRTPA